jgi:plasmid stabilization system protein ParE
MSTKLIWRGEAVRDVQEAYDWYEARSKGTGERLLAELDEFVAFILEHPDGLPKWRSRYRKVTLKTFPYQVVYRFEKSTIIIHSVFHSSRNPSRWGRRR